MNVCKPCGTPGEMTARFSRSVHTLPTPEEDTSSTMLLRKGLLQQQAVGSRPSGVSSGAGSHAVPAPARPQLGSSTPSTSTTSSSVSRGTPSVVAQAGTPITPIVLAASTVPPPAKGTLPWQMAMSDVKKRRDLKKIMIIGAGPIVIGQAGGGCVCVGGGRRVGLSRGAGVGLGPALRAPSLWACLPARTHAPYPPPNTHAGLRVRLLRHPGREGAAVSARVRACVQAQRGFRCCPLPHHLLMWGGGQQAGSSSDISSTSRGGCAPNAAPRRRSSSSGHAHPLHPLPLPPCRKEGYEVVLLNSNPVGVRACGTACPHLHQWRWKPPTPTWPDRPATALARARRPPS